VTVIVDAGPRNDGPAIVQLPENGTHVFRSGAAEMLGADLDAFGLKNLAHIS
jgi:hypothetical protein